MAAALVLQNLRDESGDMVQAFSSFYGQYSNLYAETRAMLEGIRVCEELGIVNLTIERDAQLLVDMLLNKSQVAWEVVLIIKRIQQAMQNTWRVVHIFREQNGVSDRLADLAHAHKSNYKYSDIKDLDARTRHFILLDKIK